ncbi:DMT family transporter [Kocuria sabuli]|uniref:DMT family transporter n=1 Tax=Kocuria sabuli TaxID=3071448 RepID=UPI0034D6E7E9
MTSTPGTGPVSFTARDWFLLLAAALMWGGSFLLIKLGLEDFPPATVAWLRLAFGAATLALLPAARTPLRHRRDWWPVAVLGVVWMAVPFVLFPLAEQTISSALAGMINGAAPLFTAVIAVAWYRRWPDRRLLTGLGVGFLGVIAVNLPALDGGASLSGVAMVLAATVLYGVAFNLTGPLEHRNGALPVIWRAELIAMAVLTPPGLIGLTDSTPTPAGLAAMATLGALSTGVAFACFALLIGRVGAARASITVYLVPIVAILLGAGVAAEPVAPLSVAGITLVLVGAYLASGSPRRDRTALSPTHDTRTGHPHPNEAEEPARPQEPS